MKKRRLVLLCVLVMAVAGTATWLWKKYPGIASDEPLPVPFGVVFKPNVAYCQAGGETLELDWAEPDTKVTARPAVVLIHGGAWMFGQREELRSLQFLLAKEGFVAISVDYRLCMLSTRTTSARGGTRQARIWPPCWPSRPTVSICKAMAK
jgi:hypothetical protein